MFVRPQQHLHGKLVIADQLVHNTLRMLGRSSDADSEDLAALRLELSMLNLEELDVDVESAELHMADELKLLRESVSQSGEGALPSPGAAAAAAAAASSTVMPPAPPSVAGADGKAMAELRARLTDLEVENKSVRDLLRETKLEASTLRTERDALTAGGATPSAATATVAAPVPEAAVSTPSNGDIKVTVAGVASGALQSRVDELVRELAQANKEVLQHKSQGAHLQTELEVLQLNLVDQKEQHQVELAALREQVSKGEVEVQQLQNQVELHAQQHSQAQAHAKDQSAKMANITATDLEVLQQELLDIKNKAVALERSNSDLSAATQADKTTLAQNAEALEALRASEKEHMGQLDDAKLQLAQVRADLESTAARAKDAAGSSAAERARLESELEAVNAAKQAEGAKLVAELTSAKGASAALESKHADALRAKDAEHKAAATAHAAAVETMNQKFEEEKEELMEALSQEIEEVETSLKAEAAVLEKKAEGLLVDLQKSETARLQLNQFVIKVNKRFVTFKAAHRQLKLDTTKKLGEFKAVLATVVGPALVTRCNDYKAQFAQMTNKVKEGVAERKRLHNVIQELKGNIRVYLRCRPPSQKELGQFGQDAQCVSFPLASVGLDGASEGGSMVRVVNEKGRDKTWEFDQVFDLNSTQEGVYKEVSELVTSMMDGFNVCIFAYGQTGSGKTFTMAGPPGNCGVNTRALEELFNKSRARRNDYNDVITVSVLEVYNEDIRDLLTESNGEKLEVRQSTDGSGNCVPGLTIVRVNSLQDVEQLLGIADKFRTSASTNMNEHSSRSHMMLTVYVQSENRHNGAVSRGKLNLVDLAGSERLNKSGATGTALKEAQNINKSLSALGDVIAARASKQGHIPFRNSTLTFLLQDSLSANSKTLMFVCVSPVVYNAEETFCSLNFAARYGPTSLCCVVLCCAYLLHSYSHLSVWLCFAGCAQLSWAELPNRYPPLGREQRGVPRRGRWLTDCIFRCP